MQHMNRERLLIAAFLVLTTALIVGQRFGFTWAGGTGYEAPVQATITDATDASASRMIIESRKDFFTHRNSVAGDRVARGEKIWTTDGFARVNLAGYGTVWMDQKTGLTLERLSAKEIILRVDTGRIAVDAGAVPIDVRLDIISARIANASSQFINYDQWRRATVLPVNGSVDIWHRGETPMSTAAGVDVLYDAPGVKPFSNNPPVAAPVFVSWMESIR